MAITLTSEPRIGLFPKTVLQVLSAVDGASTGRTPISDSASLFAEKDLSMTPDRCRFQSNSASISMICTMGCLKNNERSPVEQEII
ncbi:hypothetical protein CC2G_006971 [Coprinopsis cinerea AmutBmut pab1-1]|nr:hypothetical protein CC2G_006971 [Coprinopsis cinerea AmutBmut pab1-1]